MKTDIILLFNVLAMFILSFCTDYWMYRSYKFSRLIPELQRLNGTRIHNWNGHFRWQDIVAVQYNVTSNNGEKNCAQDPKDIPAKTDSPISAEPFVRAEKPCSHIETKYLFSEYGNLFRDCNDLLGIPENQDYSRIRCQLHVGSRMDQAWNLVTEKLAIGFACAAAATVLISSTVGAISSLHKNIVLTLLSGTCLIFLAVLYSMALIIFLVKVELIKQHSKNQLAFSPHQHLINQQRTFGVGWSFVSAILCLVLTIVSAYVFFAHGKSMRERRKYLHRRRQLQAALMSSCRPDVALALRAKMTVKTSL